MRDRPDARARESRVLPGGLMSPLAKRGVAAAFAFVIAAVVNLSTGILTQHWTLAWGVFTIVLVAIGGLLQLWVTVAPQPPQDVTAAPLNRRHHVALVAGVTVSALLLTGVVVALVRTSNGDAREPRSTGAARVSPQPSHLRSSSQGVAPGAEVTPAPRRTTARKRWSGEVHVESDLFDLDAVPPQPSAAEGEIGFDPAPIGPDLVIYGDGPNPAMALLSDLDKPSYLKCAEWVLTHPTSKIRPLTPRQQICIRTSERRIAYLRVGTVDHQLGSGGVDLYITVWDDNGTPTR
jgi:hypothetical protein